MADDQELMLIRIEATQTKMEKELNKALNNLSSAEKKIARQQAGLTKQIEANWSRVGKVIGVGALAGIATGLGAMAKQAISTAAAIGDTAIQAGVGVERLQALRFAASQSGGSFELMDKALSDLNKNLGEFVNTGGGRAAATFKALGIDKMISAGQVRDAESAFDAIVRGLQNVKSESQKSAYLAGVFGKEAGPKLLQLVNEGAAGIANLESKARSLGIVLSAETVKGAKDAGDKLAALFDVIKAQGTAAFANLAPQIGRLAEQITDALPKILDWAERWGDWLGIIERARVDKLKDQLADLNAELSRMDGMKNSAWLNPLGIMSMNIEAGKVKIKKQVADLMAELDHEVRMGKTQKGNHTRPADLARGLKWSGGIYDAPALPAPGGTGKAPDFERVESTPRVEIPDYKDPFAFVNDGQKRIAQIEAEGVALGMTAAEAEAYRWKLETLAQITATFGSVTEDQAIQVDNVAAAMVEAGNKAEDWRATLDAINGAQQDSVDLTEELRQGLIYIGTAGVHGFDSLQSAAARFLQTLADTIIQVRLMKPLVDLLLGKGGEGGGLLDSVISSAFSGFAGFFATGGNIPNGQWGIVGERGPEPVRATANGIQVMPNSSLRAVSVPRLPSMAAAQSKPFNLNIRQEPGVAVQVVGVTADGAELIARRVVEERAPGAVAANLQRTNSPMAKAMKSTVAAPRKKA